MGLGDVPCQQKVNERISDVLYELPQCPMLFANFQSTETAVHSLANFQSTETAVHSLTFSNLM